MAFQLMGISTRHRNCSGLAPSICAASLSSAGILEKCWRNRKVPVALAMKGTTIAS